MEMVRVGGYYLGITPANNFMGHGFYQFSPELFFGIFTRSNGYELDCLIAFEDSPNAEWYLVKSPVSINGRVTLTNSKPVYLLIVAKRIEDIEPFQSMPQQSDYVSTWNLNNSDVRRALNAPDRNLKKQSTLHNCATLHSAIKRIAKLLLQYEQLHVGLDPKLFTPLIRTDGTKSPNKTLQRAR